MSLTEWQEILPPLISFDPIIGYLREHPPGIQKIEFQSWDDGKQVEPHAHQNLYHIDHFIEGEGTYTIGGRAMAITPDTFFVLPPLVRHSITSCRRNPLNSFVAKFRLTPLTAPFLPPVLRLGEHVRRKAQALLRQAASVAVLQGPDSALVASLRLTEMIVLLVKAWHGSVQSPGRDSMVAAAVEFMKQRFAEPISIAHLADRLEVSEGHLCRAFRREIGKAPITVLRWIRCDYIKGQLAETDQNVGRIAKLAGFGNAQYMCRVFKKVVGITPSEYRRSSGRSSK